MNELSLHILDIAQNSIESGASNVEIEIIENTNEHTLSIGIYDNGCGMTSEEIELARNSPFTTHNGDGRGRGLPLFCKTAESTGGRVDITSQKDVGTRVIAVFNKRNENFIKLGDMESTIISLILTNKKTDFIYKYKTDENQFTLSTAEIKSYIGDLPINDIRVLQWIREYLRENAENIPRRCNLE